MINIPLYKPYLKGNETKYVLECLDSTWISSRGSYINKFEINFAKHICINYAATCANGTVALHLALLALEIGQNDEVIVPTFTYIASVNVIKFCNAVPIFIDSFKDTLQLDYRQIIEKISSNTKAIMVPHLYGYSAELKLILKIAKEYKLFVIEDSAEAFGTYYHNQHVGTFGDISTFSFFGNKTLTTGEGGMVCSNNKLLIDKVNHLKAQGLSSLNPTSSNSKEYWHDIIGYNYRMTNIAAAIGVAQLEQANEILEKKRSVAENYKKYLHNDLRVLGDSEHIKNSYWMICIIFNDERTCSLVRSNLKLAGIETRPLFPPIHLMPMYNQANMSFPEANDIYTRGINVPSFPDLTETEIQHICIIINQNIPT